MSTGPTQDPTPLIPGDVGRGAPAGRQGPASPPRPGDRMSLYFHVHLVSDSTGETLMNVMKATVAQFDGVIPIEHHYALVRSERQIDRVLEAIQNAPGVVMFTLVNHELRERLELRCAQLAVPCVAVLDPILASLSRYLGVPMTEKMGAQRAMDVEYYERIEALNFAMAHDDGQHVEGLARADVVLIGVSRTSKTPTCMYLAHRGVFAANIPIVPGQPLPPILDTFTKPLIVGLTITPERLVQIRRNRLLAMRENRGVEYAESAAVRGEVVNAKRLFSTKSWPIIDVTRRSIEETAAKILNLLSEREEARRP